MFNAGMSQPFILPVLFSGPLKAVFAVLMCVLITFQARGSGMAACCARLDSRGAWSCVPCDHRSQRDSCQYCRCSSSDILLLAGTGCANVIITCACWLLLFGCFNLSGLPRCESKVNPVSVPRFGGNWSLTGICFICFVMLSYFNSK